jgi:AsmA protein
MTLDYVAKPTIVNTLSGQGGKSMDQLRGIAIPVHFTGSLASPHYSLDVKAALEDKLKQGLTQMIQKKLGGGSGSTSGRPNPVDQLKSLFGGHH